jgi:hypothetical protein
MKKFANIFLITLLIFSCSSDSDNEDNNNNNNNNNNNEVALFPSQISYNDIESSQYTYQEDFTYDGNKIVEKLRSSFNNGSLQSSTRSEFIYANNLISRVDNYDGSSNTLNSRDSFEYDSQGRLTRSEYCYNPSSGCNDDEYNTYTYNSNGSITFQSYYNGTMESSSTAQVDNNGNLISANGPDGDCVFSSTLEYDNYNGPFKNVTGASALMMIQWVFTDAELVGYNNNVISWVEEYTCDDSSEDESYSYTYTYDYNDEGYPRNIVVTEVGFGEETITITYN